MVSYKVALSVSVVLLVIGVCFGWIAFPVLFKHLIQKQKGLTPGTETRGLWQEFPFPFDFSIHVLNVTNPADVEKGGKPILEDVGPFVFNEFKDKYDIQDNEDDDSVAFKMRNTFHFQEDKSNGMTGEELITIPHPLIQMIAISVKRQNSEMIGGVAAGLQIVFQNAGAFITAPFMDLFFRGIPIDCSNEHPAAKAVCDLFAAGSVKGTKKLNDTHFAFSLMAENNHTNAGQFKVFRGKTNPNHVGKVVEVDGKRELDVWSGECNKFKGTDGTIFPAFIQPTNGLWSYSADLCRSLTPLMQRKVHYAGVPAVRFIMDFGDIKNEKENTCFCRSYPDDCPAKGTMDLSSCTKAPMIASMPHFLHGDEILLKNVDGLHPTEREHETQIDFEIFSGTPLSVYKRIQFNLDMEPIAEVSGMKKLNKLVMPMFWIEESINLVPAITDELMKLFKMILLNNIIKWSILFVSLIGGIVAIYLYNLNNISTITTIN